MQTLTITVNKQLLYDRLEALTHYRAVKDTADSGAFERVALVPSNQEILEQWVPDITQQLTIAAMHLASASASTSNGGYEITLSMPDSWDNTLSSTIGETAMKYITARLAEKWLNIVDAEIANIEGTNATEALAEFIDLLHHRKRPSLPSYFLPKEEEPEEQGGDPSESGQEENGNDQEPDNGQWESGQTEPRINPGWDEDE